MFTLQRALSVSIGNHSLNVMNMNVKNTGIVEFALACRLGSGVLKDGKGAAEIISVSGIKSGVPLLKIDALWRAGNAIDHVEWT
jgi:hypothetical protein